AIHSRILGPKEQRASEEPVAGASGSREEAGEKVSRGDRRDAARGRQADDRLRFWSEPAVVSRLGRSRRVGTAGEGGADSYAGASDCNQKSSHVSRTR